MEDFMKLIVLSLGIFAATTAVAATKKRPNDGPHTATTVGTATTVSTATGTTLNSHSPLPECLVQPAEGLEDGGYNLYVGTKVTKFTYLREAIAVRNKLLRDRQCRMPSVSSHPARTQEAPQTQPGQ